MAIDGAAEYAEAKRLVTTEPEQAKVHALLALTAAVLELRQDLAHRLGSVGLRKHPNE